VVAPCVAEVNRECRVRSQLVGPRGSCLEQHNPPPATRPTHPPPPPRLLRTGTSMHASVCVNTHTPILNPTHACACLKAARPAVLRCCTLSCALPTGCFLPLFSSYIFPRTSELVCPRAVGLRCGERGPPRPRPLSQRSRTRRNWGCVMFSPFFPLVSLSLVRPNALSPRAVGTDQEPGLCGGMHFPRPRPLSSLRARATEGSRSSCLTTLNLDNLRILRQRLERSFTARSKSLSLSNSDHPTLITPPPRFRLRASRLRACMG